MISLSPLLILVVIAIIVIFTMNCAAPAVAPLPPQPVAPAGDPPVACTTLPTHIYYGSCGDAVTSGPSSCVLCDGARGCLAYQGIYCVNALACMDPSCVGK